ncbi:TPA: DNA polymerase III subunit theta [Klebsiella michiganensis]|nr:DNA polymerase III subunit theta [Klebsiella michiganensis]
MSKFNIASKSRDEQDKVNVDLVASGVAYKERLNMPVVAEVVAREQPEHLREYFRSASATIASRAFSYPAHAIRVTSKWKRLTKNRSYYGCMGWLNDWWCSWSCHRPYYKSLYRVV